MKVSRFIVIVLVALLVMQGLAISAFAGPPSGTWVTGIQVQNASTTQDAHITVTFYWAAGQPLAGKVAHVFTDTIPMGKSVTYYVPTSPKTAGVPANFIGSVVVSSDIEVAAILNTAKVATGTAGNPLRLGQAVGVKEPSTTVYVPMVRKYYYSRNTYIAVQNTANTTATVRVRYFNGAGALVAAATEVAQVPPFSTKIFYQNDNASLPGSANPPNSASGFNGSAIITGTQPLATVINEANLGNNVGTSHFESYNGFAAGSTKLYLSKLDVNYSGYQSGFSIQNVGSVAAVMTMTYKFGASVFTKVSPLINAGASWNVYLANYPVSGLPTNYSGSGSGVVVSSQPMVGVINEVNDAKGQSFVAEAAADGTGTTTVLFPKYDSNYYDFYNSGITVQNMGTVTTTLRATFSKVGAADITVDSPPVAPGSSWGWYGPSVVPALGGGFTGSVVVVSLDSQPIAGTATEFNTSLQGDSFTAYVGIQK